MTTISKPSSTIVIDATVGVWAVLPNIAETDTLALFAEWLQMGYRIIAPTLWIAEATSVIRRLAYHKIILPSEGQIAIDDLFVLSVEFIRLDQQLCQQAWRWAEKLQQSRLYDSFYVALAEQHQATLWTADKRLVNALQQHHVDWVHNISA